MCQSSSGRWPPHQTWYSGSGARAAEFSKAESATPKTWYSGSGARGAGFSKAKFSKAGMGGTYRWPGGVLGANANGRAELHDKVWVVAWKMAPND